MNYSQSTSSNVQGQDPEPQLQRVFTRSGRQVIPPKRLIEEN